MSLLKVQIATPSGTLFEGEARYLEVPTTKGPLGVLPGHTPLLGELKERGILTLEDPSGKRSYFLLSHGALAIFQEGLYVLSKEARSYPDLGSAQKALME